MICFLYLLFFLSTSCLVDVDRSQNRTDGEMIIGSAGATSATNS